MAKDLTPEFSVSIITPQGPVIPEMKVTMAVIPGIEGDLGVMAGHTPLLTTLKPGTLRLFQGQEEIFSLSLEEKGILKVSPTKVSVLLDDFCPLSQEKFHVKGAQYLEKMLKIDSPTLGFYKMESEILENLSFSFRNKLVAYIKTHRNCVISKEFAEDLQKNAA